MAKKGRAKANAEKTKRRNARKGKTAGPAKKRMDSATIKCLNVIETLFSDAEAMAADIRTMLTTVPEFVTCPLSKLALQLDRFLNDGADWPYLLNDLKEFENKFLTKDHRESFTKLLLLSFGSDQGWLTHIDGNHWPYSPGLPSGLVNVIGSSKPIDLEILKLPIILTHASSLKNPSAAIKKCVLKVLHDYIDEQCYEFELEKALKSYVKALPLDPRNPSNDLIKLEKILRKSYDTEILELLKVIGCYAVRCAQLRQPEGITNAVWYQKFPKISVLLLGIDPAAVLPTAEFLAYADILSDAGKCLQFIRTGIDATTMSEEDAFRLDILRAKLFYDIYRRSGQKDNLDLRAKLVAELERAFERLTVPGTAKFSGEAIKPFIGFYVNICTDTSTFRVNLLLTKKMFEIEPENWNLAVLAYLGEVMTHGSGNHTVKMVAKRSLSRTDDRLFFAACGWIGNFTAKNQSIFYETFVASLSIIEQEHLFDTAFTTLLAQGQVSNRHTKKLLMGFIGKSQRVLDRYNTGALQKNSFKYICALYLAENNKLTIKNPSELSLLLAQHGKWLPTNSRPGRSEDSFYQRVLVFISDVSNPVDWLTVFLEQLPARVAKSLESDLIGFLRAIRKKSADLSDNLKTTLLRLFPGPKMRDILGVPFPKATPKIKQSVTKGPRKSPTRKKPTPIGEFEKFWQEVDP
jgi:hypothetical protein